MHHKPSPKEGTREVDGDGKLDALPAEHVCIPLPALGAKLLEEMAEAVRRGAFAEPSAECLTSRAIALARLPDKSGE